MADRVHIEKDLLRRRITFAWQGAFEGYARNWVHKHFWQVRQLVGSEEDAMQECALIFARCCKTYAGTVTNARWMMSIYKRALANDWYTMAARDAKLRSVPLDEPEQRVDHNGGFFAVALSECSAEAQMVLQLVLTAPSEFVDLMLGGIEAVAAPDQDKAKAAACTINRRIRRLLSWSGEPDVIAEIKALLSR